MRFLRWILRQRKATACLWLAAIALMASCKPTPAQVAAIETSVAGRIYATLTAVAPTPEQKTATATQPAPTPTIAVTPTPSFRAVVVAGNLYVREGPDRMYGSLGSLKRGDTLSVLGQYQLCDWLKVTTSLGVTGWVKNGEGLVKLEGSCESIPHGSFRPANGSVVLDRRQNLGQGTLLVENNTDQDGLAVLVDAAERPVAALYIRARYTVKLERIADGSYRFYYSVGRDWDGDLLQFMRIGSTGKMEDYLAYTSSNGNPTNWTVSFAPRNGMVNRMAEIPPDEFPALKQP